MQQIILSIIALLTVLCAVIAVQAQECHGIQVYPGAVVDTTVTNFLKKNAGTDGNCYLTNDSLDKVTTFYQKQPGLTYVASDKSNALFVKEAGDGYTVYVKIVNPWLSPKTGEAIRSTEILILKE
jgi:hypothetical protein